MLKPKEQKLVNDVLDNFNFRRVRRCMLALKWEWNSNGVPNVPEESELRSRARELLTETVEEGPDGFGGTGGFWVTYDEMGVLKLAFEVAQWECYVDLDGNIEYP